MRADQPHPEAAGSLPHSPPLDGLRAIAVLGVLAYHAGLPWARGGFLGVDAFFVLSGYLITSLLLTEWAAARTISLRSFWARRVRRLLPALLLVLGGVAAYAVLLAPRDVLHALRLDALSTLLYGANWHQIMDGQGYFTQHAVPSPLLHTWSLAIEEQFYLAWPVLVLALLRWGKRKSLVLWVALAGALSSSAAMAILYRSGSGIARVYYGTDTRAHALLVGAALAAVLVGRSPATRPATRRALSLGSVLALAALGYAWSHFDGSTPLLYRGGMLAEALAVAVVVAAVTLVPRAPLGRMLSLSPLGYLGRISYGLYLWHWPLFLVLDHARTELPSGLELLGARLGATVVVAVASYHLVEQPIRRGGLRRRPAWTLTPVAACAVTGAVMLAVATGAPEVSLAAASGSHKTDPVVTPVGVRRVSKPPHRVLLVGDSVALTLGMGLLVAPARWNVDLREDGYIGCGLSTGGPYSEAGSVEAVPPGCMELAARWKSDVDGMLPGVAALLVGRWEVMDRVFEGRWTHIGDPAYDAYLERQMVGAVKVLSSRGARVVFLTAPYFNGPERPDGGRWPEDDPSRVDRFNSLLARVASWFPGLVTVVPLDRMLSPGGVYTDTIGDIPVRWSDGVHVTVDGGMLLAPRLLPELAALDPYGH